MARFRYALDSSFPSKLSPFVLGVVMVAAFVWMSWSDYQAGKADLERSAQTHAEFLRDYTQRTLNAADRTLMALSEKYRLEGPEVLVRETGWRYLRDLANTLPEIGVIWIVRPDGHALVGSSLYPSGLISVADREYFQQVARGEKGLVIGQTVIGRATGHEFLPIARGIFGADGQLLAVAMVGIKTSAIADVYNSFMSGSGKVMAVVRLDGRLLARVPSVHQPNFDLSGSAIFSALARTSAGAFFMESPVDGIERAYGYSRLDRFPLVAVAGMPQEPWLQAWAASTRERGLFLLVGLALAATFYKAVAANAAKEKEAKARLEDANRIKSQFLASASHDLRQPVQAARLFVDVLANDAGARNHPATRYLDQSIRAAEDLLEMLLHISALDAGIIKPKPEPVRLGQLIAETCGPLAEKARAKGLRVTVMPSSHVVVTDPVLVKQIVGNLVGNAIKYTETGRILVGCRRRGGGIRLEVADTGIGIPEAQQDAIFGEFIQLGNTERDRAKGLGLGLSIVKRTADLLGYRVRVRSVPNAGSIFSVEIPPPVAP